MSDMGRTPEEEPCFVISIAARMVKVHQQTLRAYERLGLIEPGRSRGNIRLYSMRDIARAQQIRRLVDDLGVNLAGVEVILNMSERITELEEQIQQMQYRHQRELERIRSMLSGGEGR